MPLAAPPAADGRLACLPTRRVRAARVPRTPGTRRATRRFAWSHSAAASLLEPLNVTLS
jgi:hypothetical protein